MKLEEKKAIYNWKTDWRKLYMVINIELHHVMRI